MNEHIIEYLNYYIELKNPQYAVLLIGNWGCGKTYFIKNLISDWEKVEESENKIVLKPIYVSLNGISDTNSINEKIRAAISPFLYSKGMKVAKSVFKGLIKTTAKIDLNFDDDNKSDGSVSFDIDALGIFNASKEDVKGKRIIVFDDIERCKIKTDEIFGYINNFVEHTNCNVILLTDEKKIKKRYEKSESDIDYKDFKEKLIGQTFEVKSDVHTAVLHFIRDSKNINSSLDLDKHQELIIRLFIASELQNLRVLKQALLDFYRLTTFIDKRIIKHPQYDEFVRNLLAYFIIVYAEYKTGNEKIYEYQGFNYFDKNEDSPAKLAETKYNSILAELDIYHSSYVFPLKSLVNYIEKGFLSSETLNKELNSNTFFRLDKEQDWEKLWWWKIMDDKLFPELRDRVWSQFSKGKITDTTILLHIAGIFISLIDENLINKRKDFIVAKSKHILNKIFRNNTDFVKHKLTFGFGDSSWGKQYQSFKSPEFTEIKIYLDKKVKDSQATISKDYMKELFENIKEDSVNELYHKLKENLPNGQGWYKETAVFKTVDGKKLGNRIKSFNNRAILDFKSFIHERYHPEESYSNVTLEEYHKDDVRCLIELRKELGNNLKVREKIKNRMLNELMLELEAIIDKIKKI